MEEAVLVQGAVVIVNANQYALLGEVDPMRCPGRIEPRG
jgi:hypothetical protein